MPKVTVITATRNNEEFIKGCLDSLVCQTIIHDTEIILIDNNSMQNGKEIVFYYQKKYSCIKYAFEEKIGLYHAWNAGIRLSSGKYITNLNADDRLKDNALEVMAKALDDNPDVALVYGDSYITPKPNETFDRNSSRGKRLRQPPYSHKTLLMLCICGPHPMWRRKLHDEVGYFDDSYKIAGDYEFWLRIAEKHKVLHIPQVIGLFYKNLKGVSLSSPDKTRKEILEIQKKYLSGRTAK